MCTKTEYSDQKLLELSGIFGLFPNHDFDQVGASRSHYEGCEYLAIDNMFIQMVVRISFDHEEIHIEEFTSKMQGQKYHLLLRVIAAMVFYGTGYGFKKIKCIARLSKEFNLYSSLLLTKYGFVMSRSDHESFLAEVALRSNGKLNFDDLLRKGSNLKLLEQIEFKWCAIFYLNDEICMDRLNEALKQRKLSRFVM